MRSTLAIGTLAAALAIASPASGKDVLPESGPLPKVTMERLLIIDAVHRGKRIVAVGDQGYIVYTDDNGANWRRAKSPAASLLTAVEFADEKHGWAVGHDSIILATADGGETWAQQFAAPAEQRPLLDVLFLNREAGYAIGAYGAFYETTDGGRSWTARKVLKDDMHLNAFVRLAGDRLMILGEAGTILLSTDAGKAWTIVPSPYKGSLFGGLVADDGAVVVFGLRGNIFRSTDGEKTWKAVDNSSTATLMGGTKLPGGDLVLAGNGGTILISRNNGESFVPLSTGSTKAIAKAVQGAADTVILLGEAGAREVALASAKR